MPECAKQQKHRRFRDYQPHCGRIRYKSVNLYRPAFMLLGCFNGFGPWHAERPRPVRSALSFPCLGHFQNFSTWYHIDVDICLTKCAVFFKFLCGRDFNNVGVAEVLLPLYRAECGRVTTLSLERRIWHDYVTWLPNLFAATKRFQSILSGSFICTSIYLFIFCKLTFKIKLYCKIGPTKIVLSLCVHSLRVIGWNIVLKKCLLTPPGEILSSPYDAERTLGDISPGPDCDCCHVTSWESTSFLPL